MRIALVKTTVRPEGRYDPFGNWKCNPEKFASNDYLVAARHNVIIDVYRLNHDLPYEMKMDYGPNGDLQKRWNFGAMAVSDYEMYQKLVGKKINCIKPGCLSPVNYITYDEVTDTFDLQQNHN